MINKLKTTWARLACPLQRKRSALFESYMAARKRSATRHQRKYANEASAVVHDILSRGKA